MTSTTSPSPAEQAFRQRFSPAEVAANAFHDDNDIILFMHIPKTAGMSVGKALQASFDVFHPVSWANTGKSFREKSRDALYLRSQSAQRQVLMGHFGWPDVMFWRNQELPIKLATIIRDPLARFVSNYNYNCSPRHPQHEEFKARFPRMEAYARKLGYDHQLSTMIGAFYSFDHALELVHRYYSFVGTTEHLGSSLAHFRRSHGLKTDLAEHRENTSSSPAALDEVSDAVRNLVLECSQNDLKFHKLVTSFYQ